VFRRSDHERKSQGDSLKIESDVIEKGLALCKNKFFSPKDSPIPGGSHATQLECLLKIYNEINVSPGEQVWEIGLGYPRNAILLQFQSELSVIATEIG
jgi:protein-L-isoaspartate O-methyltransferase